MGACKYVGRVGGLAVALGVGAAVLGGTAVSWADDAGGGASATSSQSGQSGTASRAARGGGAASTETRGAGSLSRLTGARDGVGASSPSAARLQPAQRNAQPAQDNAVSAALAASNVNAGNAIPQPVKDDVVADQPATGVPAPTANSSAAPVAEAAPVVQDVQSGPVAQTLPVVVATEPVVAPVSTQTTSILTAADDPLTDPGVGNNPNAPVDSPLEWTMLAYARRQAPGAASATLTVPAPAAVTTLPIIMGPSGVPIPSDAYGQRVMELYIPGATPGTQQLLFTPEGLYPITGVKSLPLNTSTDEGIQILSDALSKVPGDQPTTVFGYSQSAIISSLLQGGYTINIKGQDVTFTVPADLPLNFVLVGNEMNPDGGFLSRFSGRNMPMFSLTSLGIDFYGATPSDGPKAVTNYTREYDGFADFPRYPINFLADLNAAMGIVFVHTQYASLPGCTGSYCITNEQVENAIKLPSSAPDQNYYFMPTENLPLLEPLRMVPFIGQPLAALLQPALKVLVDLGYGDPAHGFTTGVQPNANELSPFGVIPQVDPKEVLTKLVAGVKQGIHDFLHDLGPNGSLAQQISSFAVSAPSLASSGDFIKTVQTVITSVANSVSGAAASLYAALLPTADIINSVLTNLPAYNVNLFLYGLQEVFKGHGLQGLIDAIGLPWAADVGLATTAGMVGLLVWGQGIAGAIGAVS